MLIPLNQSRTVQRQLPPPDSGRHLSRSELATMSNLEKRLQGKRTGPQSLLDKHELEKNNQLAYNYKVSIYGLFTGQRVIRSLSLRTINETF